jgi:hypothetical protein
LLYKIKKNPSSTIKREINIRRRERTNRTNGELFCISGIIFKSLMLEKDISSMKFRRMTGLRDTLLYEICSYKVKLVKKEIDIIC